MTKTEIVKLFGSAMEVARFFQITAASVSAWEDDQPIPELRELQLEKRRPDLYLKYLRSTKPRKRA